ncbi:RNA polymerase sigma factor SigM [Auraticoccus monumenti]|uniref:RNA polymerase, sigma subunit, ECF family n=1 Tax=Auraticoccus monumenti TaxID=675864 RepID=A0A1G6U2V7_9ACTN|nr:RNA polymerase sigma factor SigM [Auraticoccus monumenti]SDD34875.1 RNA polymerase, sigma subunit, ECF family [Auraticoccus monumenti]
MSTTGERSDAELLAAHVAGDDTAFAELVRRHSDRLWALALRTLRDRQDAEDALQEALISAFRRADSFRGDSAVTTWLHRVVVNACLDRIRRNQVRRAQPLPEEDHDLPATTSTEQDVEEGLVRLDVQEALGHLNADQRAALVLVDMEGYSVEDAARVLGCAPGTVKSRCSRGRAKLAPLLAHLDEPAGSEVRR